VSLESCFLPEFGESFLRELKDRLKESGLEIAYAWGHPAGLKGGTDPEALDEMIQHIEYARFLGSPVMRVVGNNGRYRFDEHEKQIDRLSKMFSKAIPWAEKQGVKLAIENHLDYTFEELMTLVENVDSPFFGITYDSGNCVRIQDDPVAGIQKALPRIFATHLKDLRLDKNISFNRWQYYACASFGTGGVDLEKIIKTLESSGYSGMYTIEIDYLHTDFQQNEDKAVAESIEYLRGLKI